MMRYIRRVVLLVLAVLMVSSTFFFAASAAGLTGLTKESDPNTDGPTDMGFIDLPRLHDGRVWTDKTVRHENAVRGPALADDEFEVTLSALSQSGKFEDGYAIPADTVFVIDLSGSMAEKDEGSDRTRIDILIEALNEAIGIIQDANPLNRIAVVAYGGRSGGYGRVEHLLPLGRYEAPGVGNSFFSYQDALPANPRYLRVNVGDYPDRTYLVQGSTPTQWGIFEGAGVLMDSNNVVTVDVPEWDNVGNIVSSITVTRRPNIILMTDGEPTMGWQNYAFDGGSTLPHGEEGNRLLSPDLSTPPGGIFLGDGLYGELGINVLTVLTAAEMKKQVHQTYFGGVSIGVEGLPGSVGFYTISLGVQTTYGARDLVRAVMDPFGDSPTVPSATNADVVLSNIRTRMGNISPYERNPWAKPIDSSTPLDPSDTPDPSMGDLLTAFAGSGSSISFHASRRIDYTNRTVYEWDFTPVSITNDNGLTITDIKYVTKSFEATNLDGLKEAFRTITSEIHTTSTGGITYTHNGDPHFEGYLIFSDVLGEYMEFRGEPALEFDDSIQDRGGFDLTDSTVRGLYEPILLEQLEYDNDVPPPIPITTTIVTSLIEDSIAADIPDRIRYFADENRNYVGNYTTGDPPLGAKAVVEVFPMYGPVTSPMLGSLDNFIHITFHVITALSDGDFTEILTGNLDEAPMTRTLAAGDQMIRWYIPAALIPMREINPDTGIVSGNKEPIRVRYRVGLDRTRVPAEVSPEYIAANTVGGSLYFYTNRWLDADKKERNFTLAFYQPDATNPWAKSKSNLDSTVMKSENTTQTATHVNLSSSLYLDSHEMNPQWLGNNGRLTWRTSGSTPSRRRPSSTPAPTTPISPKTGDNSNTMPWIVLLVSPVIGVAGILMWRKWRILKERE